MEIPIIKLQLESCRQSILVAFTFIEYLVKRAEAYLTEKVDFQGKSKDENGSYSSFSPSQTRIAHMVHQHLSYSIESAMKNAVQTANSAIAIGIAETVKIKLAEIQKGIQASIKVNV